MSKLMHIGLQEIDYPHLDASLMGSVAEMIYGIGDWVRANQTLAQHRAANTDDDVLGEIDKFRSDLETNYPALKEARIGKTQFP